MEQTDNPKLLFGLSPKNTFINAVIILFVAQVFWFLGLLQRLPSDYSPGKINSPIHVPWYYDLPLYFLSIFMMLRWIEYTFKLDKRDMSWRAIKYKFVYLALSYSLAETLIKFFLLTLFLS